MVDPSAFYISQVEIDARIDALVSGLHTKIDDIVSHLSEDPVTHYVSVVSADFSQFNTKLKLIERDFRWYKDLSNIGDVYRLMGAYADDYTYSVKECFVLDRVNLSN